MNEDRNDELASRQNISPNLVDAVRQVLAGKRDEEPVAEVQDEVVDEGIDPVNKKELKGKHKDRKDKDIDNDGDVDSSDKYLHKRRKAVSKAMEATDYCDCDCDCGKKVCESCDKPHKPEDIEEGGMSRLATQDSERKRLGADKVKGSGLRTFKKTMVANPKTGKVRRVRPSRAASAVKKGFVYAEHIEGLEEDAFKGQPTGVSVTMKHSKSGQKQTTKFPGTHSAVAGAKAHIAQMQKKGYAVHSKNLMYGKNEEAVNELSTTTLSNYMRKSAASVSGKDAKTQDKRIKGQSMADKKIRKAGGYSSDAKVAASEGTEYHVKVTGGNYAPGGAETRRVKAKSPEHAINKLKKGHSNPGGKFSASPVTEARRGRPAKTPAAGTQDTETRHNIVHQLRKSVSLRGNHKVEFKDGKSHKVSQQHAAQALNKYNSLRTTGEKARYQKDLHHSHDSFHTARQSKTPGAAPKKPGVSLGGGSAIKRAMKD